MQLVIDTTFCGDWAGSASAWEQTSCYLNNPVPENTCPYYVQNNPSAYVDGFWSIKSIKVYQLDATAAYSSSPPSAAGVETLSTSAVIPNYIQTSAIPLPSTTVEFESPEFTLSESELYPRSTPDVLYDFPPATQSSESPEPEETQGEFDPLDSVNFPAKVESPPSEITSSTAAYSEALSSEEPSSFVFAAFVPITTKTVPYGSSGNLDDFAGVVPPYETLAQLAVDDYALTDNGPNSIVQSPTIQDSLPQDERPRKKPCRCGKHHHHHHGHEMSGLEGLARETGVPASGSKFPDELDAAIDPPLPSPTGSPSQTFQYRGTGTSILPTDRTEPGTGSDRLLQFTQTSPGNKFEIAEKLMPVVIGITLVVLFFLFVDFNV